jgi:hypothetical protein
MRLPRTIAVSRSCRRRYYAAAAELFAGASEGEHADGHEVRGKARRENPSSLNGIRHAGLHVPDQGHCHPRREPESDDGRLRNRELFSGLGR